MRIRFTLWESAWYTEFRELLENEKKFWERWLSWADEQLSRMRGL